MHQCSPAQCLRVNTALTFSSNTSPSHKTAETVFENTNQTVLALTNAVQILTISVCWQVSSYSSFPLHYQFWQITQSLVWLIQLWGFGIVYLIWWPRLVTPLTSTISIVLLNKQQLTERGLFVKKKVLWQYKLKKTSWEMLGQWNIVLPCEFTSKINRICLGQKWNTLMTSGPCRSSPAVHWPSCCVPALGHTGAVTCLTGQGNMTRIAFCAVLALKAVSLQSIVYGLISTELGPFTVERRLQGQV